MTAAAILLTSTSTFAADDDDVIVFGKDRDIESISETTNQPPVTEKSETTPRSTESDIVQVSAPDDENIDDSRKSDDNSNSDDEEVPDPVIKINNVPNVSNLKEKVDDDDYNIGSIVNFAKDVNKRTDDKEIVRESDHHSNSSDNSYKFWHLSVHNNSIHNSNTFYG